MQTKLVNNRNLNWNHSIMHPMGDGTFIEQKMPFKCDLCDEPAKYDFGIQLVCVDHFQKLSFERMSK